MDVINNKADVLARPVERIPGVKRSRIGARGRERLNDVWLGGLLPLLVAVVWQIAGDWGFVSQRFLPTPIPIAEAGFELLRSGELMHHLGISLGRAALGFLLGGGLGLAFGLVVGLSQRAENVLDPSVQMLRMIPHLALAPLIILWFGFGELSKVLIIAKGAFFPLYIHTFLGIRSVDNKLFDVARVLEFSRTRRLWRLVLPAALPNILLGLRLSLSLSWLGLVVAELIGSQAGVGFLINFAKQNSNTEVIFVGILIFAVVGKLVDSLVRLLERRWLQWRDGYQG